MTLRNTIALEACSAPTSSRRVQQLIGVGVNPLGERDNGDDLLAPTLARASGDHHVGHGGVRCQRGFDFLDEDFSPPELIVTESRPSSSMWPSAVCRARSPGRVPNAIDERNVAAVLVASPL